MSREQDIARAKQELHRQVDLMNEEQAINLSKSWEEFKKWAGKILRRIGIILVSKILAVIGKSIWESIKRAFS